MAAQALCRIGPEGQAEAAVAISALIEMLGKGKTPGSRRCAAEILGEMGAVAEQAIPALTSATHDPDHSVRKAATVALAALNRLSSAAQLAEPDRPRLPR